MDCNQLNLDTGTVRTLLDGSTDEVDKMINNRDLVISETAMKEAKAYAERSNRMEELDKLLIDKNITMIPDNPSERAKKLKPTKKLQENDIVIFGTGDNMGIQTITSDKKFLRGASAQGVNFDAILHEPKNI